MSIELASQISISVSRSASTVPSVRNTNTDKKDSSGSAKVEHQSDVTPLKAAKEIAEQKVENSTSKVYLPDENVVNQESAVDIRETVSQLNEFVQNIRRELHFSIDEESGRSIVKVIDPETDKVIRQFPPEEVLAIVKNLGNNKGILLTEKA